eukprot:TRINITY_DN32314_c0_g1_i1.p1 TRINITY_DN32314_c0_g1~~TRINITY_DN32314_c0_g1_i1.p1  ORF type:complete len:655 (+),score=124.32 TRINITY_DN32314_c0_g1_i1:2-1966(+)
MTGSGKSSLGNLIAGKEIFGTGDDTLSVTNYDSVMKYEADDGSLVLLDTIGLGDTALDQDKIAASIRDVALSAPNGVDMLLFVLRNTRITNSLIARFIYLVQYLWGDESVQNLYVVVTRSSRYCQNRQEGEEWIQRQVLNDWRFAHIYTLAGSNPDRFIFVDNPALDSCEPEIEARRYLSRLSMFKSFCIHPRHTLPAFTPPASERIVEIVKEERQEYNEKQKEVARLENEMQKIPGSKKKRKVKKKAPARVEKGVETVVPAPQKETADDASNASTELPSNWLFPDPKAEKEAAIAKVDADLEKAKKDMDKARASLEKKLETAKTDQTFKKAVQDQAEKATSLFQKDLKDSQVKYEETTKKTSLSGRIGSSFAKTWKIFGDESPKSPAADSGPGVFTGLLSKSAAKMAAVTATSQACIIFDWDDTLCPTWWLRAVMEPSLVRCDISTYEEKLVSHARQIEVILKAASAIAHVDIVTLANKAWVAQSLHYLTRPGGPNLDALLQELNITFYYADIAASPNTTGSKKNEVAQEPAVLAKKACMSEILTRWYERQGVRVQWNVLSVGDQETEMIALRLCCKEHQRQLWRKPLVKTFLFPKEPMIEDLTSLLEKASPKLSDLMQKTTDVDTSASEQIPTMGKRNSLGAGQIITPKPKR